MTGLDPETARALGIAGVVATIFASLIAATANLTGQWIQRGTQLELDRRKAQREYRDQLMAPVRDQAVRRLGTIVALEEAVKAGDHARADELAEQLRTAHFSGTLRGFGLVEAGIRDHLQRLGHRTMEAADAVKARREGGDAASLVATLERVEVETLRVLGDLNRAIERYVLPPPRPWWRFWRR